MPDNSTERIVSDSSMGSSDEPPKWIDNNGEDVYDVFGFNKNAELVNSRAAMVGFAMLILTELAFKGEPVTKAIFGIG